MAFRGIEERYQIIWLICVQVSFPVEISGTFLYNLPLVRISNIEQSMSSFRWGGVRRRRSLRRWSSRCWGTWNISRWFSGKASTSSKGWSWWTRATSTTLQLTIMAEPPMGLTMEPSPRINCPKLSVRDHPLCPCAGPFILRLFRWFQFTGWTNLVIVFIFWWLWSQASHSETDDSQSPGGTHWLERSLSGLHWPGQVWNRKRCSWWKVNVISS